MESELWPSVRLCYECYRKLMGYFGTRMPGLLDGNPLACDLLGLEPHDDRYRIWIVEDSTVCKELYFASRKMTLDKSDEL